MLVNLKSILKDKDQIGPETASIMNKKTEAPTKNIKL